MQQSNDYSDLNLYKEKDLYPRLYANLEEVFPEFHFRVKRSGEADEYKESQFHLDGHKDRAGQFVTRVFKKTPFHAHDYAGGDKELINLFIELNPSYTRWMEAVKAIAQKVNAPAPPRNGDGYKENQQQAKADELIGKMQKALFSDEGKATLAYLRDVRGYKDDFIREAGFGHYSQALFSELQDLFKNGSRPPYGDRPWPSFLDKYPFVIVSRSGSSFKGFVFRSIDPQEKDKYRDWYIDKDETKGSFLFNLPSVKVDDGPLIIVEGQIDALRATFEGLPNVVACGNSNPSQEALKKAFLKGYKRVVILFDTDGNKSDVKNIFQYDKISKTIELLRKENLIPFVCNFPNEGRKIDPDTYLKDHTGNELKALVGGAIPGSLWQYRRLQEETEKKITSRVQDLTPIELDELKAQVMGLCSGNKNTEKEMVFREFSEYTGGYYTVEALIRESEGMSRDRKQEEAGKLINTADRLFKENKPEEAIKLIKENSSTLLQTDSEDFSKDLEPISFDSLKDKMRGSSVGAKTNYIFQGAKGKTYNLILPSGGLTLICGQTSHGKSRMLENLSLQLATNKEEGDVLYFSFEESVEDVAVEMVNIFADLELTRYGNNLLTLKEYYKEGSTQFFKGNTLEEFKAKESTFNEILKRGKLRIFSKYNDGDTLASAIRYYCEKIKIKAVFIDYIQLMRKPGVWSRKDELRDICETLKDLSKEANIPIVLASQLNRQAPSPVDMSSQNIADASDIEHSANIVMLLWNSNVVPKARTSDGNTYYEDRKTGKLSQEALKLEERGFKVGIEGKIYAVLDKNRGGERYINAVLDFDGNTGKIKQDYTEPSTPQDGGSEEYFEIPF